ncbi:MAG: hypothetical protein D6773_06105, partial [Alphaproteobacteria bacterium]
NRVTLWFEQDLYDQLQLIQLLSWFAENPRTEGNLELIQADDFLGHQTVESILEFEERREPVTARQIAVASKAWAAFRQPTPVAWEKLLEEDLSPLPYLRQAVLRLLEELPGHRDGVSRTEHAILIAVNEGIRTPRHIFPAVQQQEEAAFMGDWSFFALLDALTWGDEPLLAGLAHRFSPELDARGVQDYLESELHLTAFGFAVLGGAADYASEAQYDRWMGGTHLTNSALWRWDRDNGMLIAPA